MRKIIVLLLPLMLYVSAYGGDYPESVITHTSAPSANGELSKIIDNTEIVTNPPSADAKPSKSMHKAPVLRYAVLTIVSAIFGFLFSRRVQNKTRTR